MKSPGSFRALLRPGFTLIEILVVIAIIAGLAAMLVPAIGSMQRKGAMASDLNNLRQIGQGIAAFVGENDGRLPNVSIPLDGNTNANWIESVDRMMEPDKQFSKFSQYNYLRRPVWYSRAYARMPAGKSFVSLGGSPASQARYYWGIAYGMNYYLFNTASTSPVPTSMKGVDGYVNRIPNLSKLVLVGERNRDGGTFFMPNQSAVFQDNVQTENRVSRDGKAYYMFADYHVELIEGDQSSVANPGFMQYNPTNRLYYAW